MTSATYKIPFSFILYLRLFKPFTVPGVPGVLGVVVGGGGAKHFFINVD